jgi:Ca2+-binding EF-hand superfamily protein
MNTTESAGNNFSGMFASLGGVAANFLQDKMLKKMDGDGNGSVNSGEFKAALQQVGAKLGVDTGDSASAEGMFASVDANGDGELIGSEVGQMLKNMFSPPSNTDAFVQSRGDEQRFAELDTDGDGNISMAEFGISAGGTEGMNMVSTTTTTTYTSGAEMAETAPVAVGSSVAGATDAISGANPSTANEIAMAEAADTSATAPLNEDALQALLGQVDSDGDGQISGAEISAFVTQLGSQMQAASQKYNDTAMASFSTNKQVNAKA